MRRLPSTRGPRPHRGARRFQQTCRPVFDRRSWRRSPPARPPHPSVLQPVSSLSSPRSVAPSMPQPRPGGQHPQRSSWARRARVACRGMVSLDDVKQAAGRIGPYVVRTPLERSVALSERCGVEVWLKLECFQATGSFKLRGALNALMSLKADKVVTASAGNHALGVARAASLLGVSATVVVPETASAAKVEALRSSGAELVQCGPTYDEAEAEGLRLARERGVPFISAYNDPAVVAGGGTIALEMLEDAPRTGTLIVPAGGGGGVRGGGGGAPRGGGPAPAVW